MWRDKEDNTMMEQDAQHRPRLEMDIHNKNVLYGANK